MTVPAWCTYDLQPCFWTLLVRMSIWVRKSIEEIFIIKPCSWGRNHFIHPCHLDLSSVALPFPKFLPLSLFPPFPSSLFFSSSSYPNYTIVMISSIFLDISLLFSCCCFSFLFSFFVHFQYSDHFSYSAVFFLFFLHILPHSISTQFSSFISFAWFKFIITMITMPFPSSSSVSSSISAYSFFFPPLLSFLLFFFSSSSLSSSSLFYFSLYPSVTISSIFLIISWERCSPLPHFIHPWWGHWVTAALKIHRHLHNGSAPPVKFPSPYMATEPQGSTASLYTGILIIIIYNHWESDFSLQGGVQKKETVYHCLQW